MECNTRANKYFKINVYENLKIIELIKTEEFFPPFIDFYQELKRLIKSHPVKGEFPITMVTEGMFSLQDGWKIIGVPIYSTAKVTGYLNDFTDKYPEPESFGEQSGGRNYTMDRQSSQWMQFYMTGRDFDLSQAENNYRAKLREQQAKEVKFEEKPIPVELKDAKVFSPPTNDARLIWFRSMNSDDNTFISRSNRGYEWEQNGVPLVQCQANLVQLENGNAEWEYAVRHFMESDAYQEFTTKHIESEKKDS